MIFLCIGNSSVFVSVLDLLQMLSFPFLSLMLLVQPVLLVLMVLMVAFHVCFKIRLLGESLSTFRAGESVFVLVREMNNLRNGLVWGFPA